jgi:hypothetical protein
MRIFISFILVVLFLSSCSNEEETTKNNISSADWVQKGTKFCSNSNDIIAFGAINLEQLLSKGIYKSELGQSGLLPISMIDDYKKVLFTELPFYYTVYAKPELTKLPRITILARHKNRERLIKTLKKDLSINKRSTAGALEILFFDRFTIGIGPSNLVLMIHDRLSEKEIIDSIEKSFEALESKPENQKTREILEESKDLSLAVNIGNIQDMAMQTFLKTDTSSQIFDSKIAIHLSFKDGKIELENKNYLSDEILAWGILEENSKVMLSKLGAGTPAAAFLANINVSALEGLKEKYLENGIANTLQDSGLDKSLLDLIPNELAVIEALLAKDGIQSYTDGKLALAAYSSDKIHTEYSAFLGIGANLAPLLKTELEPLTGLFGEVTLTDSSLAIYTSSNNGAQDQSSLLRLSPDLNELGSAPLSGFVDFDLMPLEESLIKESKPIVALLSKGILNVNTTGSSIIVTMHDTKTNALTQICNTIPGIIIGSIFQ